MLTSFAYLFISGLLFSLIFKKMKLPGLIGMILAGMLIGPSGLDLLDESMLSIAPDLRQFALVIILTRAGLGLDFNDLKQIGKPAILMSFVPACFEIIGYIILGQFILKLSFTESALLGCVMAAVSPAVIVPRMLGLIEKGQGTLNKIPQLILAGASADDVFVIVMFYVFLSIAQGGTYTLFSLLNVPVSMLSGIGLGILTGMLLIKLLQTVKNNTIQVLIELSVAFLLLALEKWSMIPFSALLAIVSMNMMIRYKNADCARTMAASFNQLWIAGELILFVLVGVAADLNAITSSAGLLILLILGCLLFRALGVYISVQPVKFNVKEKIFCIFAYLPKATVQAAIGALPLSMGLECGEIILSAAVLAILITAPIGAILIDQSAQSLLENKQS